MNTAPIRAQARPQRMLCLPCAVRTLRRWPRPPCKRCAVLQPVPLWMRAEAAGVALVAADQAARVRAYARWLDVRPRGNGRPHKYAGDEDARKKQAQKAYRDRKRLEQQRELSAMGAT